MIPYSHQTISPKDIRAVTAVFRSKWLTQGPMLPRFERALARRVGARYAVAFSSGTAALQAAYSAIGLSRGDEIITTPLTFVATASAALWHGATPVFADIDSATGCLDPQDLARRITKRTRAIVAVDYGGVPAALGTLRALAHRHRLVFIEDAAHSLGASYRGKPIGGLADLTTFSFHPVKSITMGEGGAVTTSRREWYERLLMFRNHGVTKNPQHFRNQSPGAWYYEVQFLGQNFRLTELQAALGRSQLARLGEFVRRRRALAARYDQLLADLPEIILPREPSGARSAWHLYPIRFRGGTKVRNRVYTELRTAGIGVQVHYIPVYRHPYFQSNGYRSVRCPRAEAFADAELSLPLYPTLTAASQRRVAAALGRALA